MLRPSMSVQRIVQQPCSTGPLGVALDFEPEFCCFCDSVNSILPSSVFGLESSALVLASAPSSAAPPSLLSSVLSPLALLSVVSAAAVTAGSELAAAVLSPLS